MTHSAGVSHRHAVLVKPGRDGRGRPATAEYLRSAGLKRCCCEPPPGVTYGFPSSMVTMNMRNAYTTQPPVRGSGGGRACRLQAVIRRCRGTVYIHG
jgi:hypothetical protein